MCKRIQATIHMGCLGMHVLHVPTLLKWQRLVLPRLSPSLSLTRSRSLCLSSSERLVFYCRTTSASTAPRTPRRTCCPYAYVLITVLRVSRSCELFPDGSDLHLLHPHPRPFTLRTRRGKRTGRRWQRSMWRSRNFSRSVQTLLTV